MGRQPYVRYSIEADVNDKGIGFSIKRAIQAFLKSHSMEGLVTDFNPSSDHLEAVLEVYDNGNPDLNMSALIEHVHKSGRMPSNRKVVPTVKIKPIPLGKGLDNVIVPEKATDDLYWQKTIESVRENYEGRIKGLETELSMLTHSLAQRQTSVDELATQKKNLEARLNAKDVTFDSPLTAILNGYLRDAASLIFDADADWTKLDGDRKIFVNLRKNITDKISYVNSKYGLSFKSEQDFEDWRSNIGQYSKWEETPEGQNAVKEKNQLAINLKVFEDAQKAGASEDVIRALRPLVSEDKVKESERKAESVKENFDESKAKCDAVKDSDKSYAVFRAVQITSAEREKSGRDFPIVMHFGQAKRFGLKSLPSLQIYLPSVDKECEFEKEIVREGFASFSRFGNYTLSPIESVSGVSGLVINSYTKSYEQAAADLQNVYQSIASDSRLFDARTLAAFGLNPRVIALTEEMPRKAEPLPRLPAPADFAKR